MWTSHRCAITSALLLTSVIPALSQKSVPTPSTSPGTAGSAGTLGTPTAGTGTLGNSSSTSGLGGNSRAIFISGRVMFDDGSPANTNIRIERVCSGGSPRLEAHADSKGRFYFQAGSNSAMDADASEAIGGSTFGHATTSGLSGALNNLSQNRNSFFNCDLQAAYPGYRSDVVNLGNRRAMDEPDIGTIMLHRLGSVKGTTVSITTALAPKGALKDYQKGIQFAQKGDNEQAEKFFTQATDKYPQYALAWFSLAELQLNTNRFAQAQKSYETAIAADPKYVSPYDRLSYLFGREAKWQESADYSRQALDLNPVEFPSSYWYNSVANYNLKHFDQAEKSALGVLKVDSGHRYPEAEMLLSSLLADKGEYSAAAGHLRAYLTLQPGAKNADSLKVQLAKLEQVSAQPKKPAE